MKEVEEEDEAVMKWQRPQLIWDHVAEQADLWISKLETSFGETRVYWITVYI